MTSFPATTETVCFRALRLRSSEHTEGAAKQWHRTARTAAMAPSARPTLNDPSASSRSRKSSSPPPAFCLFASASFAAFSAAASTSASPLCTSMARIAATPAPMLCPVTRKLNPGLFTSAAAAFGSCVLHTWYADMTMPLCAQPPRKGVEVLTASVSRSPVLTVPLIASTTVLPALSTHT